MNRSECKKRVCILGCKFTDRDDPRARGIDGLIKPRSRKSKKIILLHLPMIYLAVKIDPTFLGVMPGTSVGARAAMSLLCAWINS